MTARSYLGISAADVPTLSDKYATLADDSEETLVGSSLHQDAITALYTSLSLCGPYRGLPWFVDNQLQLVIPRPPGRPYKPSPDILVHPTLTNASRDSLIVAADSPPALIVEVASPSTVANDIDLQKGKAAAYRDIGVADYLVFDPTGDDLGTQVWARRAEAGRFVPWLPDDNGRWVSAALGIAFAPGGVLLRVYDQEGALVPVATEQAALLAERDRRLAERDRRLAELEEELRALRDADA